MITIIDYLKENLTERKFYDICDYVEELFLMEYDLLILLARKFYNLFFIFHEINKEKYDYLPEYYKSSGRIITDRCLPLIREDIKKGKFKKIILADDIIIHGRTVESIYKDLIGLNPDINILISSYMRNSEDNYLEKVIEPQIIMPRYIVKKDQWREMSDEFVNIFFMSGRPYISYLPFFSISQNAYNAIRRSSQYSLISIQDADMMKYGVEAYMVCGSGFSEFSKLDFCQACVARVYKYSVINKIIVIPYFCFNALRVKDIAEVACDLRKLYCTEEYNEISNSVTAGDFLLRELEYITSTWIAFYLFSDLNLSDKDYQWNRQIEKDNFYTYVLKDNIVNKESVKSRFNQLKGKFTCISRGVISDNMNTLWEEYGILKRKYSDNWELWKNSVLWNDDQRDFAFRLMQNLMVVNGNIDEERCDTTEGDRQRLCGIPIGRLLDSLTEFINSIDGANDNDGFIEQDRAFAILLKLVDSGKGTIVTSSVVDSNQTEYVESLIYAGEQNYKFYESTNYPIMYGLYILEILLEDRCSKNDLQEKKEELVKKYILYLSKSNIFYVEGETQQLAAMDISENYGTFLRNSYNRYRENRHLKKAVSLCFEVCADEQCNKN